MLRCHADCPLPPPLFRASSPLRPISPRIPGPLHPCLNLLKRRRVLTVVISHHAATALCGTSAQYTSGRGARGHYDSRHLGGADEDRPSRDLPILSCFILVRSVCARTHLCVQERGSRGCVHQLARPSTLPSARLERQCRGPWRKQHKKGHGTVHRGSTAGHVLADCTAANTDRES